MTDDPRDMIALTDVPGLLPRRHGKPVNYTTVWRWASRGCYGRRLQTRLIGGVRYTDRDALARFFDETNAAAGCPEAAPAPATPPRRPPASRAANRRLLAREGLLQT